MQITKNMKTNRFGQLKTIVSKKVCPIKKEFSLMLNLNNV